MFNIVAAIYTGFVKQNGWMVRLARGKCEHRFASCQPLSVYDCNETKVRLYSAQYQRQSHADITKWSEQRTVVGVLNCTCGNAVNH
jgi:hypothetical protein